MCPLTTWSTSRSRLIRVNGPISELKDGSELVLNNGLFILNLMNNNPEKSDIFKFFSSLDIKEKELRAKIDMLIRTNAIDEIKEQEQKKERFVPKKKVQETTTVVITKKVSQAEKKKLLKQQKKNEEEEEGTF